MTYYCVLKSRTVREHELPEHIRSHPEISGVRVAQSLAFYVVFCNKLKNKNTTRSLKE